MDHAPAAVAGGQQAEGSTQYLVSTMMHGPSAPWHLHPFCAMWPWAGACTWQRDPVAGHAQPIASPELYVDYVACAMQVHLRLGPAQNPNEHRMVQVLAGMELNNSGNRQAGMGGDSALCGRSASRGLSFPTLHAPFNIICPLPISCACMMHTAALSHRMDVCAHCMDTRRGMQAQVMLEPAASCREHASCFMSHSTSCAGSTHRPTSRVHFRDGSRQHAHRQPQGRQAARHSAFPNIQRHIIIAQRVPRTGTPRKTLRSLLVVNSWL